ncbi:MAG TPA: hypothetical protein VGJ74_08755 [Burkholderiales bacterium]
MALGQVARGSAGIPVHYTLWNRFPAWYHVLFIASLVLFTLLGAMRRLPR